MGVDAHSGVCYNMLSLLFPKLTNCFPSELCLSMGHPSDAVAIFEEALASHPGIPNLELGLGRARQALAGVSFSL